MPKKILTWIAMLMLFAATWVLIENLDIALRLWEAQKEGSLNGQKIRYEIAAFGLGKRSANIPSLVKIAESDGMKQMFVEEGEFIMGTGNKAQRPRVFEHRIYLDAFWMDQVEVTNAMYEKCVEAGACLPPVPNFNPYYGKWIYRNHPVVYTNWFLANAYCEWAGRRLPTEAEWEKTARGNDRRVYPWGDENPNPLLANFDEALIGEPLSAYRYPLGASPYGALNLAGNVREWVWDWYDEWYYGYSPYKNPSGPESGTERLLRSGAYDARANGIETYQRYKHEPDSAGLSRGFRCAESAK